MLAFVSLARIASGEVATVDVLALASSLLRDLVPGATAAWYIADSAHDRLSVIDAIGPGEAAKRFVATTDPATGDLRAIARQENYPIFEIPPNVGGRFSVLTPVGTLPAALLGFDVGAMMQGARDAALQARKVPRLRRGHEHDRVLRGHVGDSRQRQRRVDLV